MKLPELVQSLSLPLPAEEDHGVDELDGGVRVKKAGTRLAAHRSPHSGH